MRTETAWGKRRFSRPVRYLAVGAVVALAATACSRSKMTSTSTGSGSTAASGGSSSAPGVTASSITVGSHQPLTGAAAPGYSEIAPAAKAMFDYTAKVGGVYHLWGHSWEIHQHGDWERLAGVFSYIAGRPEVSYAANGDLA